MFTKSLARCVAGQRILQKNFRVPSYQLFFQKQSKKSQKEQEWEDLNRHYKDFLQQKRYSIREPFTNDYFISNDSREKQLKEAIKMFGDYYKSYKFDTVFDEDKLLQLLSKLSYTVDNREVVMSVEFAEVIAEIAEKKITLFKSYDTFVKLVVFCSIQDFKVAENVWQCFTSHILNSYKKISHKQKISILQSVNDKNYFEFKIFFTMFEDEFLKEIHVISKQNEYIILLDILSVYRKYQKGSKNFFLTIQEKIKSNIQDLSMDIIVSLLLHYATSRHEEVSIRNEMLDLFEPRIIKLARFLTTRELTAILFCYLKLGKGSVILMRSLEERILNTVDEMTILEIKRFLTIASVAAVSLKKAIFTSVERYIIKNINKIPKVYIAEAFYLYCENGQGGTEFFKLIEKTLLDQVFLLETHLLCELVWGFAVLRDVYNPTVFFSKVQEATLSKIPQMSVKDISIIVWSFGKHQFGSTQYYEALEKEISARLVVTLAAVDEESPKQAQKMSAKDCAHLLWGYVQNRPLQLRTLQQIIKIILTQKEQLDTWDLSTILWAFARFENLEVDEIYKQLEETTLKLIDEMGVHSELVQSWRSYVETRNESDALAEAFATAFDKIVEELNYDNVLITLYAFSSMTKAKITQKIAQLIEKLGQREERLRQIAPLQEESALVEQAIKRPQSQKVKTDFSDVEEYFLNLDAEKYKQ